MVRSRSYSGFWICSIDNGIRFHLGNVISNDFERHNKHPHSRNYIVVYMISISYELNAINHGEILFLCIYTDYHLHKIPRRSICKVSIFEIIVIMSNL